jgi:hypothetical protein
MKNWLTVLLMAICSTSAYSNSNTGATYPSITSQIEKEEIFDLPFTVVDKKENGKYSEIVGKGSYKGKTVGLRFKIEGHWKSAKKGKLFSLTGPVYLESIGKESDLFIQALTSVYQTGQSKTKFKNSGAMDAVSFGSMEDGSQDDLVIIKVFGDSDIEADYFEFLVNYEPKAKRIWLAEKDEGYRSALLNRIGK